MKETMYSGFAELLREQSGFDVQTVGVTTLAQAVRRRLLALGMSDAEEYLQHVKTNRSELQELLESVVVLETWFFRHAESFAALTKFVRSEWLPSHPTRVLHVLSIPCSSGEEPYSITMALLDGGVAPARFEIDAVDVSTRALALAKRAIYRENSFRSDDLTFRERYFSATADGYRLADPVREQVTFLHDNLLEPSTRIRGKRYDVIFCRNVLIYFDAASQQKAISNLERLLESDGLLFIGPAETSLPGRHRFTATDYPAAFAYRKAAANNGTVQSPQVAQAGKVAGSGNDERSRSLRPPARSTPGPTGTKRRSLTPTATADKTEIRLDSDVPAVDELAAAARLADEGRLQEAAALCETHLRQQGASATAFYLLGLIHDVEGDPQAIEFYRKALYLEPRHTEALAHLSLLLEKQGDADGAKRLRARAQRVEEQARA